MELYKNLWHCTVDSIALGSETRICNRIGGQFRVLFIELGLYKTGAPKKNGSESNAAVSPGRVLNFETTLCLHWSRSGSVQVRAILSEPAPEQ